MHVTREQVEIAAREFYGPREHIETEEELDYTVDPNGFRRCRLLHRSPYQSRTRCVDGETWADVMAKL